MEEEKIPFMVNVKIVLFLIFTFIVSVSIWGPLVIRIIGTKPTESEKMLAYSILALIWVFLNITLTKIYFRWFHRPKKTALKEIE